jgi:hypothetical protein
MNHVKHWIRKAILIRRLKQQVNWVVKQAGKDFLQGRTMSALLRMPIPQELAAVLVGCGARLTFAQQVAAVPSRAAAGLDCNAPGPHVWMPAYQKHKLARPSDMPAVAEALRCGDKLTDDLMVRMLFMHGTDCKQLFKCFI